MTGLPSSPTLALAVGALGSGAANVAWTWQHGPVRIAAGIFATLLVPVALHLWPRVPVTGRPTRVLRALVMGYICAAAAAVNLAHAVMLLVGAPNPPAEHTVLAVLLITAVEAVMVMASLARRAPTRTRAAAKAPAERRRPRRAPAPAATPLAAVGSDSPPWAAQARVLIADGVPKATAYRRARKEHQRVGA